MPLHENFSEYTEDEINKIKERICKGHRCPYCKITHTQANSKTAISNYCCDYILYTGHVRNCMPDECKHYLDKNVPTKKIVK